MLLPVVTVSLRQCNYWKTQRMFDLIDLQIIKIEFPRQWEIPQKSLLGDKLRERKEETVQSQKETKHYKIFY